MILAFPFEIPHFRIKVFVLLHSVFDKESLLPAQKKIARAILNSILFYFTLLATNKCSNTNMKYQEEEAKCANVWFLLFLRQLLCFSSCFCRNVCAVALVTVPYI